MNQFQERIQKACFGWKEIKTNIHILMMDYEGPNHYRIHTTCEKFFRQCELIIECGNNPNLWNLFKALIHVKMANTYYDKLKRLNLF